MRKTRFLFAALLGLGIGLGGLPQGAARADDDADQVARLIQQLGSKKFTERDRAKRALEALGAAALPALKKAAESKDFEISAFATRQLKKLEEKRAVEDLLAPKHVRLNIKDTPVLDAVAQLAKQSGYAIEVQGDRTKLADRKVTLDTGDTTFWQAFDQLCRKAGLTEMNQASPSYGRPTVRPLIQPQALPIRIQPAAPPGALPVVPPAKVAPPPAFQQNGGQIQLNGAFAFQAVAPAQAPQPAQPRPVQAQPAQPAPIQIQIQIQAGGQVQPVPVQIQPGRVVQPARPYNPGQITLQDGKPKELPTSYHGAVRVRALPAAPKQPGVQPPAHAPGEVVITLEVAAEPRLAGYFQLTQQAQVAKAIDDLGQKLSVPMEPAPVGGVNPAIARPNVAWTTARYVPMQNGVVRYTTVRLKLGEKHAKKLTELSGHVPVTVLAPPQALITVDDVLKAAGKTVKGEGGGSLDVMAIEKQADGTYKVQFRMESPPNFMPVNNFAPGAIQIMPAGGGGQIQIQIGNGPARPGLVGGVNDAGLPKLVDAKGQAYQLVQIPQRIFRGGFGGVATQEITMVLRAPKGAGEPARFVLSGQRPVTVQVPFTLHDVPLP